MTKEERRQKRIEELQRRWDELQQHLGVLESSKIKETRPEEQIRLQGLIDEAGAERQRVEDELETLESGREPPPAETSSEVSPESAPVEYRYDIFLAHASADKPDVEAIARRLNDEQEPLVPFLDQWHLIPGNDWVDELGQSLNASRTCAVFFGPSGLGPWENEELRAALERKSTVPEFRVIPVLLPGAVMPDKGPLPSFLNRLTWVDFRNGLDDAREYHRLVCGIRGIAPGPEQPEPAITEDICPYLGLRTFQEEDEPYFFGRDALSQWLVEKLRDQRFLAVIGPSGSGKSSAVRAGLIPALKRGALTGSEHWSMLLMVPTANPLTQLAAKLAQWRNGDLLALQDQLAADTRRLHAEAHMALLDADPAARLLLIVDQFEELYTLRPEQAEQRKAFEREREAFLDNLLYAATVSGGRVIVTVAMRADFYARTAQHRQLADCMAANQVLVTPMAATELTEAIVGPARKVGLSFDDGLVDTLRDDVLGQPGSLPLLEHALKELWERRQDRRLTLQAYRDIGGISGALAQRAEAEYARLTPDQQTLARQILLRLVQLGEGAEDTRRRARLSELPATTEESTAVEAVVQTLSDARLLITARDTATGEELLDVSHEALIRNWPRLRGWLDEDRDALRFQRKLGERAEEWQRLERDPGGLLRGTSLEEAENWAAKHDADMNTLEREFIAASVKLRQDEADEQQRIQQEREAAQQRELEHARSLAEQQSKLAETERQRSEEREAAQQRELEQAHILAEEQSKLAETERQRSEDQTQAASRLRRFARLLAAISVVAVLAAGVAVFFMLDAEKQQAIAEQKTVEADKQREIAENKSREAEEQRAEAEKQRIIAERQSRLARARQLAAQSESYREPWLQRSLLLALEAATATRKDDRYVAAADEALREALAVPNGIALRGHESWVLAVAFSPDGRTLASASYDRTVRLWDRHAPGDEPLILRGHEDRVWAVAFSPDGRALASASLDGTVRLWDRHAPGDEPLILRGHEDSVRAVAFSPDGRYLASASDDRTVRLWDRHAPGDEPLILRGHEHSVSAVAFSPDGRTLASASIDRTVRLWDRHAPGNEPLILRGHEDNVYSVAFSPDGRTLASASSDRTVRLWDQLAPGNEPLILRGHEDSVSAVAFSPDGRTLASASLDRTVRLWDRHAPGNEPLILRGHEDIVWAVAFSPDGRYLASASSDRTVRLWDRHAPGDEPLILRGHEDSVRAVAFSPDGRTLASASDDRTVRLWDRHAPGDEPLILRGHEDSVRAVAFSLDGHTLASASDDRTVRLWDRHAPGDEPLILRGHEDSVRAVAFSPDWRTLASASSDRTVRLWNRHVPGNEPLILRGHEDSVSAVAFSPDGRYLASASYDRTVRLWDRHAPGDEPLILRGHESGVSAVAFSPDGRTLASASYDRTVRLWDRHAPGDEPLILRGHDDSVRAVAFSPDGRYLASASLDGTVLWDRHAPGDEPLILRGHEDRVWAVAFSPDGRYLASASSDRTVRLWLMDLDELITLACRYTGRNLTEDEWRRLLGEEPYHKTCARWPAHPSVIASLLESGRALARAGEIEQATALFQRALELEPTIGIDPDAEARREASSSKR